MKLIINYIRALNLDRTLGIFYKCVKNYFPKTPQICLYDFSTKEIVEKSKVDISAIVDIIGVSSFLTVPLYQRGSLIGRIYITSSHKCFVQTDIEFLLQLMDHILPVLENVELLDRLASEAAEQQRQKISRDIHDSTIQPYIGLKLGLEAIELKRDNGDSIKEDIEKLIQMADNSINDLRSYIRSLRNETADKPGTVLITAVKQQALKFQEFYGIKVDVESTDGFRINDRLAAEAFQIITESLSNIKRHTSATQANIKIHIDSGKLILEIVNDSDKAVSLNGFIPKSITGRAKALGGNAEIRHILIILLA
jgi:signal transduction histidine kinase